MIRILRILYANASSQVWDGNTLSDPFPITVGVKQGCLLSPILFSLYLNDLHDFLPNGLNIGNTNIKVLMYADDLILLSDSSADLQVMINALYEYCSLWSLQINLSKSKIMVFRKGARLSSNLKWFYGSEEIEIVNEYKYLGITLTYNLSLKKHLESKLSSSKMAINSTWTNYIRNSKISLSNKLKIFNTAAKSILFYGAQVWGYERYEQVEKLFRFFIKKILYLPLNTPNYMLHIETGLPCMYIETLKLHFSYINKVLAMPDNRLPKLLAKETITSGIYWVKKWNNIFIEFNLNLDFNLPLNTLHQSLIDKINQKDFETHTNSALMSQFHDEYPNLNFTFPRYFNDSNTQYMMSLIFKARCGLLNINCRAFQTNTIGICTLCNLDQPENTFHFIAICPIFSYERNIRFGKTTLSQTEFYRILNGENFVNLYMFLSNSLNYRNLIVNEFN